MRTSKQFALVSCLLIFMAVVGALVLASLPTRGASPEPGKSPRALLQFAMRPPQLRFSTVSDTDDDKRCFETQCALFRSKVVLDAALEQREVRELPSIKDNADPIAWLQQHLEAINLKDSEIIQVSLSARSGASAKDQAVIINAIVKAYMDEVADAPNKERANRHAVLKKLKDHYSEILMERRDNLRKLSEVAGPLRSLDRKKLSRQYYSLRSQQLNLRLEQAEAETLLARRKQGGGAATEPGRKEIAQLEDRLAVVNARQSVLDKEVGQMKLELRGATRQELDLEAMKEDISQMEDSSRKVSAEVEALNLELGGPPRVRVIEQAVPPTQ